MKRKKKPTNESTQNIPGYWGTFDEHDKSVKEIMHHLNITKENVEYITEYTFEQLILYSKQKCVDNMHMHEFTELCLYVKEELNKGKQKREEERKIAIKQLETKIKEHLIKKGCPEEKTLKFPINKFVDLKNVKNANRISKALQGILAHATAWYTLEEEEHVTGDIQCNGISFSIQGSKTLLNKIEHWVEDISPQRYEFFLNADLNARNTITSEDVWNLLAKELQESKGNYTILTKETIEDYQTLYDPTIPRELHLEFKEHEWEQLLPFVFHITVGTFGIGHFNQYTCASIEARLHGVTPKINGEFMYKNEDVGVYFKDVKNTGIDSKEFKNRVNFKNYTKKENKTINKNIKLRNHTIIYNCIKGAEKQIENTLEFLNDPKKYEKIRKMCIKIEGSKKWKKELESFKNGNAIGVPIQDPTTGKTTICKLYTEGYTKPVETLMVVMRTFIHYNKAISFHFLTFTPPIDGPNNTLELPS